MNYFPPNKLIMMNFYVLCFSMILFTFPPQNMENGKYKKNSINCHGQVARKPNIGQQLMYDNPTPIRKSRKIVAFKHQ